MRSIEVAKDEVFKPQSFFRVEVSVCVKNSRANSEQAARQRYSKTFNRKYALTCLHCLDRLLQSFRSGRITATKNG